MVQLTSFLLVCLISAGSYVAGQVKVQSIKPPELWPPKLMLPQFVWPPPPPGAPAGQQPKSRESVNIPVPKSFGPYHSHNAHAVKPPDISQGSHKKFKSQNPSFSPKALSIHVQASPEKDNNHGQDNSQRHGSGHFHQGTYLGTSQVTSHRGPIDYPIKYSQRGSNTGVQLSLSVTLPTITAPPTSTTSGDKVVQAEFSYFQMPVENKPADHPPVTPKPQQSKFIEFFKDLIPQRGQGYQNHQTNTQTVQQSSHGQNNASSILNNFWMQLGGSTVARSTAQTPVHQTGIVYSPHQWYYVPTPQLIDNVAKSALSINGQLMIPLEKCQGFEKLVAYLKVHGKHGHHTPISHDHYHLHGHNLYGHRHQHGHTLHGHRHQHGHTLHGHRHQHGHTLHGHRHQYGHTSHGHHHQHGHNSQSHHQMPSSQDHFYHQSAPSHGHFDYQGIPYYGQVINQGPSHPNVHQQGSSSPLSGHMDTKPPYAQIFLNVEATATSPTESTNAQPSAGYQGSWWQNTLSGRLQYPWPDQIYNYVHKEHDKQDPGTNYMVQQGANVDYDKQRETTHSYYPYAQYRRH